MLPRFLIADNSQESIDKIFVVHTKVPRCIIECEVDSVDTNQEIHWIDAEPSADAVEMLLEEADKFLFDELENQENLYDQEIDDEE